MFYGTGRVIVAVISVLQRWGASYRSSERRDPSRRRSACEDRAYKKSLILLALLSCLGCSPLSLSLSLSLPRYDLTRKHAPLVIRLPLPRRGRDVAAGVLIRNALFAADEAPRANLSHRIGADTRVGEGKG